VLSLLEFPRSTYIKTAGTIKVFSVKIEIRVSQITANLGVANDVIT
jgi:hypothetical protein